MYNSSLSVFLCDTNVVEMQMAQLCTNIGGIVISKVNDEKIQLQV